MDKAGLKKILHRGFTLLELLLVLIIIAMLAGLASPAYMGSVEKMRNVEAIEHLIATRGAMMRHYDFYGSYASATIPMLSAGNLDFNPNTAVTGNSPLFAYRFSAGPAANTYTLEAYRIVSWTGCAPRTAHVFMDQLGRVTYSTT